MAAGDTYPIGTLWAALRLQDEYSETLKRASAEIQKFGRDYDRVGRQLESTGRQLSISVTAPLVAMGAGALKAAIDFESSFAGVRKTVTATEAEFAGLAAGFRGMAREIPVSVNQLNRIGEAAGQLGIKTSNITAFTRVVADLGVTTNLSTDAAATGLARLANITGLSQDKFSNMGSAIVALGNNFATTEAEILDFGLRIAGAGNIAGLTEPQILAIGTAMSSVGVEAEAGGTAVQKVLLAMTEASATGGRALEVFGRTAGVTAAEFASAFRRDAGAAFAAFVAGLGEQGERAFKTLDQLGMTDQRLMRSFLSLANAGDLLTTAIHTGTEAFDANIALAEEAGKRYETTASRLAVLKNRAYDAAVTMGEALMPSLDRAIKAAEGGINAVGGLARGFAALPGPVQDAAIAMAAMAAAIGPLLLVSGALVRSVASINLAFAALAVRAPAAVGALRGLGVVLSGALGAAVGSAAVGFLAAKEDLDKWTAATEASIAKHREHAALLDAYRTITDDTRAVAVDFGRLTDEQKQRMLELAKAVESGRIQTGGLSISLDAARDGLARTGLATEDTTSATEELARAVDALRERKAALVLQARAWVEFAGRDVARLPEAVQRDYHGALQAVIDRFGSLRDAGLAAFSPIHMALDSLVGKTAQWGATIAAAGGAFAGLRVAPFDPIGLSGLITSDRGANFSFLRGLPSASLAPTSGYDIRGFMRLPTTTLPGPAFDLSKGGLFDQIFGPAAHGRAIDLSAVLNRLGPTVLGALQGGGSVGASVGALFGGELTKGIGDTVGKKLGGVLGSAIGSVIPGLGTLLGGLGGSLIGKLFGGGTAGQDLVRQFQQSFGGSAALRQELTKLGDEGERLWIRLTQGVGKNNPQQAQAAIDAITAALERQRKATEDLRPTWQEAGELAEKYGINVEALGPKFQQAKLIDLAQQLALDWRKLTAFLGSDVPEVLEGLADEVQDILDASFKLGLEVPPSLRPLIEKLMEMGKLTDENGELLDDLGKITWSKPIEDAISKLIDKMDEFINRLLGIGPAADVVARGVQDMWRQVVPPAFPTPQFPFMPGETFPGPGFHTGTQGRYLDFGRGTLAMLHGRERIMTEAEGRRDVASSRPLVVQLVADGRVLSEVVVPHIPGELARLGLRP